MKTITIECPEGLITFPIKNILAISASSGNMVKIRSLVYIKGFPNTLSCYDEYEDLVEILEFKFRKDRLTLTNI